ncbi:hypothetical protein F5148DRAFT_1327377 [Russula earlei]|uniref:Uncharacterized protein n=1 Tax=Russula earlei TaxID=71964 RepID=A0ACC0TZP4_9AGAM|nr:hypothetical protein F5148DRAFT_1327377 [Russula earlei]
MAMGEQFPILERLFIWSRKGDDTGFELMLPKTFQAPNLRGLALSGVTLPLESPLLTTTVGLSILVLESVLSPSYLPPGYLLARLSSMTQLQDTFPRLSPPPVPNRLIEGQLSHTQAMTHVNLPNLRALFFRGVSSLSTSHTFLRFTDTLEEPRFTAALLIFYRSEVALLSVAPRREEDRVPFRVQIHCTRLDWQVAAATQVFRAFSPILSVVENLTLHHYVEDTYPQPLDDVDPSQWRELLRIFHNVKTLSVADGLVGELSRSLQSGDEETSLELLPELQELRYSGKDAAADDAFSPFVRARHISGRPLALVHDA